MKQRKSLLLVGGILLVLAAAAACIIIAALIMVFATNPLTVGPTFTTAEALAYDVVYESNTGDMGNITVVQSKTIGEFTVVVVTYDSAEESGVRHLLAREEGRQYLVETADFLGNAAASQLTVEAWQHYNRLDSELIVYGRIHDPNIQRVQLFWSTGFTPEATIVDDTFLFFQSWSPVDGSPTLSKIVGYDAAANIVVELTVMP